MSSVALRFSIFAWALLCCSGFVPRCHTSQARHLASPCLVLDKHAFPASNHAVALRAEPPESLSSSEKSSSSSLLDKPVLAALDLVALLVFAGVGKASHASDGSLDLAGVAVTALPFIVAWFSTSFVTRVYSTIEEGEKNWLAASWKQTAQGWIVAIPLGCVGRGLIKGYVPPAPFVVVTMIATLVILGGTRTVYNFATVASKPEEK
jgi:hypothetical protein